MKILLVEDDEKLAGLIKCGLASVGHAVDIEHDGESGEFAGLSGTYDAVVLDVMLPKKDGMTVLRALRSAGVPTPVLILTARDGNDDVVAGLDSGADDYLRKPFALSELYARIRSLGRRAAVAPRLILRTENLVFDTAAQRVVRGDREIALTGKELMYLEFFMRNSGRVITRGMLENALWGSDNEISSNVIDVYVARLRSKIEFDDMPPILTTVRGIGYRFG